MLLGLAISPCNPILSRLGLWAQPPAGPSAPTWSAQPGPGAGQVSWAITAPPTSLGDGPIAGDGEGVLTGYAVEINGVVTTYGTTLPRSGTSSGWSSDMPVQIAIWSIGYEGRTSSRLGTVIYPPAPADLGPAAPGWTPIVGPAPGEAGVLIHTTPIDLGDGPIAGDGAGVLTGYVTRIGGVEVIHGTTLPISRIVTGLPPVLTLLEVQSIGYDGRRGPVSSAYVTPIAEPENEFPVLIDAVTGAVLIDAVSEASIILDSSAGGDGEPEEPEEIAIPDAILTSGRSTEMVAPEGIAFSPDLDLIGTVFGMAAPAGDYDPRMHDLRYEWSFGDPGEFVAPVNVRPGYKNSNVAVGFAAAHVYRAPGNYTVRLDIRGTIAGQPAHAWSERTVTIGDPETIFAGSRTYFVSPSSDWSQAPVGAQRVTSLDDAAGWANEDGASGPYRIMLNRGEVFTFGGRRFGFNVDHGPTIHVVAGPGSGPLPALTCTGGFGAGGHYDPEYVSKTLVAQDVVMTGPYDPVAPSDPDVTSAFSFWGSYSPRQILIDRCEMRGFGHGVYLGEDCPRSVYVSDSVIEGYGQWGIMGGGVDGLYLLGSRVQSHANAPIDNGFDMGGTIRLGGRVGTFIASKIDGFIRQGWSGAGGGYIAAQPVIRVEADEHAGQRINITGSSFEGGFTMLSLSRGSGSPTLNSVIMNMLVEDCYFLGGYQTTSVIGGDLGGLTLRDNTAVIPDTAVRVGPGLAAFLELHHFGSAPVLASPINVINNTIVNFTSDEIAVVSNAPGYSAVTVAGTISHQPALTPPQPSAVPLVTAPPMWTPREIGYRSTTVPLVTDTATPPGVAASYAPPPEPVWESLFAQTSPGVWELLTGRTASGVYETLYGRAA